MKKNVFLIGLSMVMTAGLFAQNIAYKVGDTGPGGGIIFYDKGVASGGWRYLEAAPAETEFFAQWGAFRRDESGTAAAAGSGKQNTQLISASLNQANENGRAAQLCASLNCNGVNDWFLPGKEELDLMYRNLKQKDLGGFSSNYYWSSSQHDDNYAWGQRFEDGIQVYSFKNRPYSVRAVRAFQ